MTRRFLAIIIFAAAALHAAPGERGRATIRNFRTRDLEARGAKTGPQMFAIAQDQRGLMYLANNLGVVELDNQAARLIGLPHRASALSLDVDAKNRVWVGGAGNLGYLAPDARGNLAFVSLLDRVPADARNFGDVWQTSVARDGIYFRTPSHLLRWDGHAMRFWTAPNGFHIGNVVNGRLIVRQPGLGLSTVDGDQLHLLAGGEQFKDEKVYVIQPWGDGRLFLLGRTLGVVLFDPTGARPPEFLRTEADALFKELQAYHGTALQDGNFAIATLRGGVIIIDRAGRLIQHIDKKRGLLDDFVFFAYAARDRHLWLGLNYGASAIDDLDVVTKLPNEGELGLDGFVESVARFEGKLYVSTSHGIYRMTAGGDEPRFAPVASIAAQCYTALPAAGTLLVATREGIVQLDGERKTIVDPDFAYHLMPARENANRVIVAYDDGVGVLEHGAGGWRVLGRNREAGHEVVQVADAGRGEVWGGTESDGLYQLRLENDKLILVRRFGEADGLPEAWVYPQLIDGRLVFLTHEGIFRREGNRFVRDERFASSIGARPAFRIEPSLDGNTLWLVSDNEVLRLDRDGDHWKLTPTGVRGIGGGDRILSFLPEGDVLWIGADSGLYRYLPANDEPPAPPRAIVRAERNGNAVRFTVAGAPDADPLMTWRLDGFDRDWSPPSREARKEYTNLPGGRYTFRIAAIDRYEQRGPESAVAFAVRPPWYGTWWAIALFVAAGALLIILLLRLRGAQLRRRNRELERIVAAKTAELREASYTDPLTGLRNRRYFAEVLTGESDRMVLLLIDLDYFKTVNDRYGHAAGDAVLVETARRLQTVAAENDLLFRWGGEEFLLVARGAVDGATLAERARAIIASTPFRANGDALPLTASVGWAQFPGATDSLEGALDLADHALYRAKEGGRNVAVGADA